MLRRDRLREAAVERRRKDDLGPVADPPLAEVPVGEERELDRCNGTLDRHVDDVHDEPSAVERAQRILTSQSGSGEGRMHGEGATEISNNYLCYTI